MPEESETEEELTNYNERITVLRYVLEQYMNFDSDEDIPEPVIDAFVDKIVVKENSFDWYLFFSGDDDTPKGCNVIGNKKSHKIELLKDSQTLSFVNCNTGCNCQQVIRTDQILYNRKSPYCKGTGIFYVQQISSVVHTLTPYQPDYSPDSAQIYHIEFVIIWNRHYLRFQKHPL